jgi:hypothetical protein
MKSGKHFVYIALISILCGIMVFLIQKNNNVQQQLVSCADHLTLARNEPHILHSQIIEQLSLENTT